MGKGGARQRNSQNGRNRGQTSGKRPCNRCGKGNHTTSECTFSRSVKCSKCDKLGHIGPACRGAARHGSPPPVESQRHRIALARSASMKKLRQQEQSQLKPCLTQPRTRDGRRHPPSTYDYHRWDGRPYRYELRRTLAQRYPS